jgi:hypothetical protein
MATASSIAIRRDAAQERIQAASIELAAKYGVGEADLSPRHKQPAIEEVLRMEAIASFLEQLAEAAPIPVKKRKPEAVE